MKKPKKIVKNRKMLVVLCILLWVSVITSFLGFVQYKGGLKPEATFDDEVFAMAGIKLISPDGVVVEQGKVTLSAGGENHYFYTDTSGKIDIQLTAGSYKITAEAPGYSTYQSTVDLTTIGTHAITLYKKP